MFTRIIYPLSLREKIACRIERFFPDINDKNIPLEFNKDITLDLLKTDVWHRSIIFNGFFEIKLSKDISRIGAQGGILVDVGANYGYFSCLWASKNPGNKVFAFEASPLNIHPLTNNILKNALDKQITVIPSALGKETGILNFSLKNEDMQTGWGGFTIMDDANAVTVSIDTLDNYALKNGVEKIDILKIDTEGADTWVLYGAKLLLQKKIIKNIYFEENLSRMALLKIDKSEAWVFLEALGYIVEKYAPADYYAYPEI